MVKKKPTKPKKPTVKQAKTARLILDGKTKTDAAQEIYDIDLDKPGAQTTAIQLANVALDRFVEYEGKTLLEVMGTPQWFEEVCTRLKENMRSPDGNISNKAIELWAKLSGNLINKSAHWRKEDKSSSYNKWKKN